MVYSVPDHHSYNYRFGDRPRWRPQSRAAWLPCKSVLACSSPHRASRLVFYEMFIVDDVLTKITMSLLQYWKTPGPLAGANLTPDKPGLDKFLGILSCIVQAAFSFQGIELVAVYVPHERSSYVPVLVLTKCIGPLRRRRALVATSPRPSVAYSGASWSST